RNALYSVTAIVLGRATALSERRDFCCAENPATITRASQMSMLHYVMHGTPIDTAISSMIALNA
ncbi:TPA: hypothetical protein ACXM9I_005546, partial [Pseudomonas aeruginosa]